MAGAIGQPLDSHLGTRHDGPQLAGHCSAGGTSIGAKGMMVAAKTLALTAIDLFRNQGVIAKARSEFDERRGPDFAYEALLGDRDPPLDYRLPGARR